MVEMAKETEETEKETDGYMEREKREANRQADRQLKHKSVGKATASPLHDVQIMKRRNDRSSLWSRTDTTPNVHDISSGKTV